MRHFATCTTVLLLATACATASPPASEQGQPQASDRSMRTLVMVGQVEPASLSSKVLQTTGGLAIGATQRLFNATLTATDKVGLPQPYLVEALPQLNTDTWSVSPDGRMETTYRLKQGLVWHDGTPLTAEDVAFTWRLLTTPEIGEGRGRPQVYMEEVLASDPFTVVIRWRQPFRDADDLDNSFPPFPRHLLEPILDAQPEVIGSQLFWTSEYVGLGPFHVDRWELGAYIEASAFDQHVWGRPKIDRIKIIFAPDANTALASLLSGEAHASLDDAIRFEQGFILKQNWEARSGGTVLAFPDQWRRNEVQHRPEYASPTAILDLRVRKALSHSVEKQALSDLHFHGENFLTESVIPQTVEYAPLVDASAVKYPFDLRRAEALMNEAGLTKDSQGFYTSSGEGRLTWEIKTNASAQSEEEVQVLADAWRRVGLTSASPSTHRPCPGTERCGRHFPRFSGAGARSGKTPWCGS